MKSRWIKLCSILLVLTMLINMLPVHALALDSEDRGSASVQGDTESHTVQIIGEVEGLREEGIKHFRLSDGSFVAVSYGLPVHFQNSGGQWIDIDNRLSLAAGAYRTANANAPAAFPSTLANGKLFTVEHGGQSVSMSLLDTTMADQMISGELDTDPEETLPAEETKAATEPIVETTAETEPSIEETVPAEPATEPETTIPAEETDVITEESLPEELPESGETEAMSGEDPENTADFAEGETEPTVSTQPTPTEKTVETQPEATETEPAETGASETEETVPALSATEETIPEETEPEETGPEDLDEATGLVFNRDVVAEVTTDTPAMLTLQDKYNWDVNDVIPQKLQSSLIYQDVFPGIDLQYTNFGYNIKEQIIINEPQESYRFDFLLESSSLTAVLNENSSVSFLNSDQEEIYRIPIPCMEDASGLGSFDVHFALNETEQGTVLTVEADKEWINSEERTYPVKIDPTLVVVSGRALEDIYSVYTMEAAPNDTTLGRQWLYVGAQPYSTSNDGRYRTYMHFQTMPTVPSGSEVVDAQLSLYKTAYTQRYCEKLPIGAYEVTTGLPSGYSSYYDWFSKMTWRRDQPEYDASNAIDYAFGKAGKEYVTWHLTELVKKWYIEGTSNTTIALAMTNEDAIQTTSYYASATFYAYAGSIPPILTVSYRNNTGIEPYYTYATLGAGEAGTAYISDHTGQLKIAKELVSYASSTNPFSLNLVYNSDYFARSSTDYCPPAKLGLSMNVGSGWTLDCIQRVESETISNISYLKYSDGDGTIHYFSKDSSKDSSYYYDEDGLSLKIKSTGTNAYLMSDDDGNEWTFTGNYLTSTKDSDGNKININYSSGRLSSITQEKKGQSAITMATFTYSGNDLISVTDAAGNVYTLTYSGTNLVGIKRSSSTIASYTYSGYQATKMTDSESGYSLSFTYSNGKVSRYQEVNNSGTGATVSVTYPDHSETVYRDHGADRVSGNSDDVLTHYLFDYAGRTVNAYTTDNTGNILGATNAVYSGSGSTDKANNRTLRTGSIGVARQQLLSNPGLEDGTGGWTFNNGTSRATTKPRTGSYSIKGTLSSGSQYALVSSGTLTAGKPYTVSGYVNTSAVTKIEGGGVSITVPDGSQGWTSQWINYSISTAVDDGWVRISVTFTPPATDEYGIFVNNNGAIGTFYADDFQVEEGDAPSSYNLVTNSNMEGTDRWTMGTNAAFSSTYGVAGSSRSLKITGDPLSASTNAYQDITLNLPGTQTYVLSGWARANAVPDDPSELDNPNDVTKKCGLRATITYSDGATEGHYVAFNSDISNQWQFTSISIVPKQPTKTVQKIRVTLAYEGNANDCYFDNIALLREVAQTMKYDSDGKLVSVTSTGLDKDENTYSGGNLIKTITGGNGTFTYTYDTTYTHRLKSVSNGQITQAMGYDSTGNVTTTTLSGSGGKTIQTTAAYGGSGNRLTSVTDAAGATVSYSYGNSDSVMRSLPTSVTDPNGIVTTSAYDTSGRVTQTGIANTANLLYTYTNGNLSAIQRTNSSGASQTYNFTYDSFGNMLSVKVGSRNLAANIYANGNGQLTKQTYGNGATVNYTYDILGRIKTATYSDGRQLTSLSRQPPVVITTQPENYYGTTGSTAIFTVAASGDRVTYQWQCSTDDGETWSNVNGSTSTTLNIPIQASVSGNLYRCIAKDYMGHAATSQAGKLTVTSAVSTLSEFDPEYTLINEPDDYYGRPGDTATFIVEAEGANLSYQWLCRAPGSSNFEYLTGETSPTLRVEMTAESEGAEYRCFITDANGDMGSTRIATVKLDTRDWQMEYNTSGLRTRRISDDNTYSYIYAGDKLMRMTVGDDILDFSYDANGAPLTMTYNGTVYYYITNLQGDVMAVESATGSSVAQYVYDAWGNIIAMMGTLAELNPLRYRGYVYDQETGFYYLQSRYYDPAIGRFINADNVISYAGHSLLGCNVFAYCFNNPVNMSDDSAHWPKFSPKTISSAISALVEAVVFVVITVKSLISSVSRQTASTVNSGLPRTGEPGSSVILPNPDGTPKQKRWYGPDGYPERDRDYNHAGDMPFPHDHEWKDGKRGKDHLAPDPAYKFSWTPVLGIGLVLVCAIGTTLVAADNITGIGVADDVLLGPLGAGIAEGFIMIFK